MSKKVGHFLVFRNKKNMTDLAADYKSFLCILRGNVPKCCLQEC